LKQLTKNSFRVKNIAHHESDEKALNAMINIKTSIPTADERNQQEEKK
jgi:hypothetical protein